MSNAFLTQPLASYYLLYIHPLACFAWDHETYKVSWQSGVTWPLQGPSLPVEGLLSVIQMSGHLKGALSCMTNPQCGETEQ